jgi:hypothetical protein
MAKQARSASPEVVCHPSADLVGIQRALFGSFLPHSTPGQAAGLQLGQHLSSSRPEFLRQGSLALTAIALPSRNWQWMVPGLPMILFVIGAIRADSKRPPRMLVGVFSILYSLTISAGAPFCFNGTAAPAIPIWLIRCCTSVCNSYGKCYPEIARKRIEKNPPWLAPFWLGFCC